MKSNRTLPYIKREDGLHIFMRLTPNSATDEVFAIEQSGSNGPYFKARVRAQPEKGKANKALIKLIAQWLKISKSTATLKSGSQSRLKTIEIINPDDETIERLKNHTDSLS